MPREKGRKVVASNKKARHDYAILDTYEAGMARTGTEVKSLRAGRASLVDAFAQEHGVFLYLQPGGPDTAVPFHPPEGADLHYRLPEFDVRIYFGPTDFTQVNHAVNRVLVRRALRLLGPRTGERIADFFCGLGNFALPIARSGAHVLGIEGSDALVARARTNAARNGLAPAETRTSWTPTLSSSPPRCPFLSPAERQLAGSPRFRALAGTAEQIPLPDSSCELAVAAQAFHWFRPDVTRMEFRRILRREGIIALIWNSRREDSTPFLRAYEELLQRYGTDYGSVNHRHIDTKRVEEFFRGPFDRHSFPHHQDLDREGLRGRLLSSSLLVRR